MRPKEWAAKVVLAAAFTVVAGGLLAVEANGTNRFALFTGEKIYDGRLGPWLAEARLLDPKTQVEEARASGKIVPAAPAAYRLVILLGQPRAKTPLPVAAEKGTVTVMGPSGKRVTAELAPSRGYFGTDLVLETPGTYEFSVEIQSGGKKGTTTFVYTIR